MATVVGFSENTLKEGHLAEWRRFICGTGCPRCGGLMVTEDHDGLPAQRCVQCGEFIDPVVLQNRHRSLSIGMS